MITSHMSNQCGNFVPSAVCGKFDASARLSPRFKVVNPASVLVHERSKLEHRQTFRYLCEDPVQVLLSVAILMQWFLGRNDAKRMRILTASNQWTAKKKSS